jgi:tRNA (cytidine/uridine-2'-O-)-methyltransferase
MHVVLVEPQIAPNTGSIIRLCANTGAALHLVEPLGFEYDDARLRRGGLDYHEFADVTIHPDVEAARAALSGRWFVFTAAGGQAYTDVGYEADDVFVFGTERTGLSVDVLGDARNHAALTIPMRPESRSVNLANAVSIVVYEAWRQHGFAGAGPRTERSALAVEALARPDST